MTRRIRLHQMSPAEHAAMGRSHGQYRDGYCLALMSDHTPEKVAAFKAQAEDRGAEYVALFNLPEYLG